MENNVNTLYLDVDDRIDLVNLGGANYRFMNIDKYNTWGVSTDDRFMFKNLNIGLGASLFGESQSLNSQSYATDQRIEDEYRYHFQGNASVNYQIPNWATTFSVYYKYTGKSSQFILDQENSTTENSYYILARRDDFSMLDASIRKGFYDNRFEVTVGARNILDVTSINDEAFTGQGHNDTGGGNVQLFYGRSYFLKLVYNLEF